MPNRNPGCCTLCCKFILSTAFSILFFVIFYSASRKVPRIYLSHIHATGPSSPSITCQIEIKNRARFLGIYYDDLLVSVSYTPAAGINASAVVPAFYQGFHKRALKEAALLGGPWVAAVTANNGSAVYLRVGVDTKFRYKATLIWKSKRHGLSVSEDIKVNAEGNMTSPDHILLRSAAQPSRPASVAVGTTLLLALLLLTR